MVWSAKPKRIAGGHSWPLTSFSLPPLAFRDKDGNYRGRVVLALMVDTEGRVVPGTVAVSESTESRLSLWACAIAGQLSFIPAILGGKLVLTMVDQPLTYFYGEPPPGMTKP